MDKQLLEALNKRYATKLFDREKKLSEDQLAAVLESVRLTPTSYGMQLMKVVVVENDAIRTELVQHSHGQKQVSDASHLLVLCSEQAVDKSHVDQYISTIANTREIPETKLDGFKEMMENSILTMDEIAQKNWMEKQVYIALGNLLTCCAVLEVDACPMEGFDNTEYDRVLGLADKKLTSVLVVPIGYRSKDDRNAINKKVRRSSENFIVRI